MKKKLLLGLVALAAIPSIAIANGVWNGFPEVGDPGNTTCLSYGSTPSISPGNCNQYSPAGPSGTTGLEMVPADTGSNNPASVYIPTSVLGFSTNRLIGGDMTTNLAQRLSTAKGVSALAALSPTSAVMTADRWWVIAPAAGVTVTIDSTASSAVIPGFNNTKALRVARTSGGAAGIVCVGQTLDKAASFPLIGNNAVFSFYEENGSTQSATSGNITVNIDYTSAADTVGTQATLGFAGGNGSKFALGDAGQSGTPTNYTNAVTGLSSGTTGSITSGVATIKASTAWNRYSVWAAIPTNVPGTTTPVTSVSVSICWTPTATTAVATDYIEINGMQLEAKPSATALLPNGGSTVASALATNGVTAPNAFEKRPASLEALLQYSYLYFNYENQSLVAPVASCENIAATGANCYLQFPVPMRIAPAMQYTAGFQAFAVVAETSVSACSALATYSNTVVSVPSQNGVFVQCTASVGAAGTANQLLSLGTSSATGIISASAEP
jgi:hypothetical protein